MIEAEPGDLEEIPQNEIEVIKEEIKVSEPVEEEIRELEPPEEENPSRNSPKTIHEIFDSFAKVKKNEDPDLEKIPQKEEPEPGVSFTPEPYNKVSTPLAEEEKEEESMEKLTKRAKIALDQYRYPK